MSKEKDFKLPGEALIQSVTYEWDISSTRKLNRLSERSSLFTACSEGLSWWYLTIAFDSIVTHEDSLVYTSLHLERPDAEDLYVQYRFHLNGSLLHEGRNVLNVNGSETFSTPFEEFNSLNSKGDSSVMSVRLLAERRRYYELNRIPLNLSAEFGKMASNLEFCDVTILLEKDKKMHAHQCILGSRSSVLCTQLENAEIQSGKKIIYMKQVQEHLGKKFLQFLYTGWVFFGTNDDDIWNLLLLSRTYKVSGLGKKCCKEFIETMSSKNLEGRLSLAMRANFRNLTMAIVGWWYKTDHKLHGKNIYEFCAGIEMLDACLSFVTSRIDVRTLRVVIGRS